MDFGRRRGASDEHIPKWICKERATTPPLKRHAALRVALKLAWGFVARSVEFERNECIGISETPHWAHLGSTTGTPPLGGRYSEFCRSCRVNAAFHRAFRVFVVVLLRCAHATLGLLCPVEPADVSA